MGLRLAKEAHGVVPHHAPDRILADSCRSPAEDLVDRFGKTRLGVGVVRSEGEDVIAKDLGEHLHHLWPLVHLDRTEEATGLDVLAWLVFQILVAIADID